MNFIKSFELKPSEDTKALLQALGSKDRATSDKAQVLLAALMGPKIAQVLATAKSSNIMFLERGYSVDDPPVIGIEPFFENGQGTIPVTVGSIAGGRFTAEVKGTDEYYFTAESIASQVSFKKTYMRRSRPDFDVVSRAMARMTQEVAAISEDRSFRVVAGTLASARTGGVSHVIASAAKTAGGSRKFGLADMNALILKNSRLRSSWNGGTPTLGSEANLTDLVGSPELAAQIRAFVYNPVNTTVVPSTGTTSTAMPAPESLRDEIYRNAGAMTLFGKRIHTIQELGAARYFNYLFGASYSPSGGDVTFDSGTEELVLGLDLTREGFVRMIAEDDQYGRFSVVPDDSFTMKDKTVGFWGEGSEAPLCLDNKVITGLIW